MSTKADRERQKQLGELAPHLHALSGKAAATQHRLTRLPQIERELAELDVKITARKAKISEVAVKQDSSLSGLSPAGAANRSENGLPPMKITTVTSSPTTATAIPAPVASPHQSAGLEPEPEPEDEAAAAEGGTSLPDQFQPTGAGSEAARNNPVGLTVPVPVPVPAPMPPPSLPAGLPSLSKVPVPVVAPPPPALTTTRPVPASQSGTVNPFGAVLKLVEADDDDEKD